MGKRSHINSESSKNARAEQNRNYNSAKNAETARHKAENRRIKDNN